MCLQESFVYQLQKGTALQKEDENLRRKLQKLPGSQWKHLVWVNLKPVTDTWREILLIDFWEEGGAALNPLLLLLLI